MMWYFCLVFFSFYSDIPCCIEIHSIILYVLSNRHDFFPLLRSAKSDFCCCPFRLFRSAENQIFFWVRSNRFWTLKQPNSVTTSDLIGPIFHIVQWQVLLQYWPQSCVVLFRHVGMYSRVVVDRGFDTKTLDKGLKSVWKWELLGKKVGEELIGRFIRKIKTRVNAYCELCNKDINSAGRGWKSLEQHLRKKLHSDNANIRSSN